jgi:ribose-phosphate pyrophosphokinase
MLKTKIRRLQMITVNGTILDFDVFPNGETKVNDKKLKECMRDVNHIKFKYEDDSDLIKLLFVKSFLDEYSTSSFLVILYMPYSRMDRKEGMTAFTLKYLCDFINSMNFEQVTVIEPHSDVTPALLDRAVSRYVTFELLDEVMFEISFNKSKDYLCFPDATAQKRYGKVKGYKQLAGFKKRDFTTGEIQGLQLIGDEDLEGNKVIIWDDLCSYGGTFLASAEKLKEMGAGEIYLLVGHCEPSIYKGKMLYSGLISKVFTTNTIINESEHENIRVFKI